MKVGKPTFITTCLNRYGASGFSSNGFFSPSNLTGSSMDRITKIMPLWDYFPVYPTKQFQGMLLAD